MAVYVSANVAYYLVLSPAEMRDVGDRTVAAAFAFRLLGATGLLLAAAAVGTSVFGSLNGNLLVGPRLLYAMGQDRLAPAPLARLHPHYQTPFAATMILAGWSIALVVLGSLLVTFRLPVMNVGSWSLDLNLPPGKPLFDLLTDYAMFGAVSFETLAVSSIFLFRRRYPPGEVTLPYRCPLYPLLPLVYVTVMTLVLVNMFRTQRTEALAAVGFIAVGALIYGAFFARRSGRGEPAEPLPRDPEPETTAVRS
jgi:amino acid transporter